MWKMNNERMGKIVVTGGCGYIGSHTIVDLIQHGFEVVCVDSLINSKESVLDQIEKITGKKVSNHKIDLSVQNAWQSIAENETNIDGIIHFAALKAVGESVEKPLEYYHNNIGSLMHVLEWMRYADIVNFIFSSSCTVYGNTHVLPVHENTEFKPCSSPYGRTKQMGEWIVRDVVEQSELKAISLRYFNPAGAHDSLLIGEQPFNPPLNLVPVITETVIGKRDSLVVFGDDYDTPDGTCIRDYIHVMDIARAHTLAVQYLIDGVQKESYDSFNLGMEKGMSVLEIIKTFERVNNVRVNYKLGPRRPGDMAAIYADTKKANSILNWRPEKTIEDILRSAWLWEQKR
jgi:UDP-glucose 4-epimerase